MVICSNCVKLIQRLKLKKKKKCAVFYTSAFSVQLNCHCLPKRECPVFLRSMFDSNKFRVRNHLLIEAEILYFLAGRLNYTGKKHTGKLLLVFSRPQQKALEMLKIKDILRLTDCQQVFILFGKDFHCNDKRGPCNYVSFQSIQGKLSSRFCFIYLGLSRNK